MKKFIIFLLLPICLFARHPKKQVTHPEATPPYIPWFSGPFLAPSSANMELGKPSLLLTLLIANFYGTYDDDWQLSTGNSSWQINPSIDIAFAFTEKCGFEIFTGVETNIQDGKSSTNIQDSYYYIGYQVSNDQKDSWIPDFRLYIQGLLPTGNYQNFDPKKINIEGTGQGAFFSGPGFAFQKLFYLEKNFFVVHGGFAYMFPTKVKVHGFNAFGGGFGTRGRIRPGQLLLANIAGEYSFSQRFAMAVEGQVLYQTKSSTFSGKPGKTFDGKRAFVGALTSNDISLAIEMEYSISINTGFLFGVWGTIAGQNTSPFASFLISLFHGF